MFAELLTTGEIEKANLQLTFWKLVCEGFEELRSKLPERDEQDRLSPGECASQTREEIAVLIVLAGTSVSQIVGQHMWTTSDGPKVPGLKKSCERLHGLNDWQQLPTELKDFIKDYDNIRHFGPPKRAELLGKLKPDRLSRHLFAAQEEWKRVLTHKKDDPDELIQEYFDNDFNFI